MTPGRGEAIAIAGLGVALAILLTYPVASRFANGGRIDSGDGQFAIWNVAWVARTLVADPGRLYDANIFYPDRHALAFSEANVGAGLLAIPAWWATRNPYVAYNFVLLFGFSASVVSTYYLARYLTGSARASVAPAIAFAFCPYIFARVPHIQLQMTAGLPLALLAFHRLIDHMTLVRAFQLGVILGIQGLACAYYGIFAGLTVGLGVVLFGLTRGKWMQGRFWLAVLVAAATSILIVLPFFLPYLDVRTETGFARSLDDARQFPADWRAYLASSAYAHRWMLQLIGEWKEVLFPGFMTTGLGLAGLWLGTRACARTREPAQGPDETQSPGRRPDPGRDVALFYGLIGLVAGWASFGPAAGLYTLLYYTVPVFSFLRAPGRFGVMVTLALVGLSALALGRILRDRSDRAQKAIAGVVTGLVLLELVAVPIGWRDAPEIPRAYRVLATLPPAPVAAFPFFWERIDFHRHTIYMLHSTAHWRPLVNGYSDHIPEFFRQAARPISSFPSPAAFHILARDMKPVGVKYVVFHLDLYDRRSRERLLERLRDYQSFLRPLVLEDNVWLYEIVGWPA